MRPARIRRFLGGYRRELARHGVSGWRLRRRILGEAGAHLREAARRLEAGGLERDSAEEQAVRRFGEAAALARVWSAACDPSGIPVRGMDWAGGSAAGLAVGLIAALSLGGRLGQRVDGELLFVGAALLLGVCLGVGQWLLLRSRRLAGWTWIAATGVAFCGGLLATSFLWESSGLPKGEPVQELAALLFIGGGTGAVVGALQRLVLRGGLTGRGEWVLRSCVGMGLGTAAGGLAAEAALGGFRSATGLLLLCIAGGLATGLSTAAALRPRAPDYCSR
ncbi:MAG TPA: hypothetical protein VF121_05525 [Thermoanaerobaculia bacterium]|nr:hypothetical protein [Thermoanaerobaculia bacterium]